MPSPPGAAASAEDAEEVHPDHGLDVDAVLVNQGLVDILDAMQTLGVDITGARRYVKSIRKPDMPTFVEVYGQGKIVDASRTSRRSLNIRRLDTMAPRTGWDCTTPKDRHNAMQLLSNPRSPNGSSAAHLAWRLVRWTMDLTLPTWTGNMYSN